MISTTDWFWYVLNTVLGLGLGVIGVLFIAASLGLMDGNKK